MASSILRKKKDERTTDAKRSVSFGGATTKIDNSKKVKTTHFMHEEEEDMLDPTTTITANNNGDNDDDWREVKQIREAKAARAMKRTLDDKAGTLHNDNKFDRGGESRIRGEEEVDKHFSLLHDIGDGNHEKIHCPIEPFNLTSEREDGMGYFDGDTYVFRKNQDDDNEEDAWLDDVNTYEDEKGSSFNSYLVKSRKKNKVADNAFDTSSLTKEQIYEEVIPFLATNQETILQALGRYGNIIKRENKVKKKRSKTNNQKSIEDCKISEARKSFDRLTELANFCMMHFSDGGDIYEQTKENFSTLLKNTANSKKKKLDYFTENTSEEQPATKRTKVISGKASTTSADALNDLEDLEDLEDLGEELQASQSTSKSNSVGNDLWYYVDQQDNTQGPFADVQMRQWLDAGYFKGDLQIRQNPKEPFQSLSSIFPDLTIAFK